MKRRFLLMFLAVCLAACSDDFVDFPQDAVDVCVVNISNDAVGTRNSGNGDNTVLSFNDKQSYDKFMLKLNSLDNKAKQQLVNGLGFVNLVSIAEQADEELEMIGEMSKTESDFRLAYHDYKRRYDGILVSNDVDSLDLSLYTPAVEGSNLQYVINGNHKIIIGGEFVEVPVQNRMNEQDRVLFANNELRVIQKPLLCETRSIASEYAGESDWPVNGFVEVVGSKKTIFSCELDNSYMSFHFGSQKKMWYGWKRDNDRCFYFRLYNVNNWHVQTGTNLYINNLSPSTYYFSLNGAYESSIGGSFECLVGPLDPMPYPVIEMTYSAKIYVWTDLMCEKDANGNTIYQTFSFEQLPTQFPLFVTDNSFPSKILLVKRDY